MLAESEFAIAAESLLMGMSTKLYAHYFHVQFSAGPMGFSSR